MRFLNQTLRVFCFKGIIFKGIIMRFIWEQSVCANFLEPAIYFVGATFEGTQDQLPRFVGEGVWENGWAEEKPILTARVVGITAGDILIVKRLLGKGSNKMAILALGVVVGRIPRSTTQVSVEWVLPEVNTEVAVELNEATPIQTDLDTVGTISPRRELGALPPNVQKLVKLCQIRFLRMNLSIMRGAY